MNNFLKNLLINNVSKSSVLCFVVTFFIFTLSSCSSDETPTSKTKFVNKIIDVNEDGTSITTLFNYDNAKIVSAINIQKNIIYTYSNDLITKIITFDNVAQTQTILDYTYTNNRLVKITSSDNYAINFTYNDNGTISYEKLLNENAINEIKVYFGILYFQSENLVKDERTIGGTPQNEVLKDIKSYEYDSKRNPLNNIIGYSKLLDYFSSISANNVTRTKEESRKQILNTDQITSSEVLYVSNIQYDADGYPTTIISEKTFFGEANANHAKTQIFYR